MPVGSGRNQVIQKQIRLFGRSLEGCSCSTSKITVQNRTAGHPNFPTDSSWITGEPERIQPQKCWGLRRYFSLVGFSGIESQSQNGDEFEPEFWLSQLIPKSLRKALSLFFFALAPTALRAAAIQSVYLGTVF
jgi:hypothetical protein